MKPGPAPADAAQDCRDVTAALLVVADLCTPHSDDPFEIGRLLHAAEVGPVFRLLGDALLARLDTLDQALSA